MVCMKSGLCTLPIPLHIIYFNKDNLVPLGARYQPKSEQTTITNHINSRKMKKLFLLIVACTLTLISVRAAATVNVSGTKATITTTSAHEFDAWLKANPTALNGVTEVEFTSGSTLAAGDINELGEHGLNDLKKVTASGVTFTTSGQSTSSITLTQIEELVMDDIKIGNYQPVVVTGCSNLKTLSMKNADLSTAGSDNDIIQITNNPALESVDISGSQIKTNYNPNGEALKITGNASLTSLNMLNVGVQPEYGGKSHKIDISDNASLKGTIIPAGISETNTKGSSSLEWIGTVDATTTSDWSSGSQVITTTINSVIKVSGGGQLTKACQMLTDAGITDISKLKVTGGPLNSTDVGNLNATTVDLSGATMSASLSDVGGSMETLMLPNGYAARQMSDIQDTKAPNLKIVGSITNKDSETLPYVTSTGAGDATSNEVTTNTFATTELAIYQKEKNHVADFASAFNLTNATLDKLSMAGNFGNKDLANGSAKVFNSNKLHYFDFTGATFDQITVTADGERVTTNSMYYLKNYNVFTCKLPTGNTDVPPEVFSTDNGGWSSPLVEIEIPEGYTTIGYKSFYHTHITDLMLPSSITKVGKQAFYNLPLLESVEMQPLNGSATFGEQAFASCFALKHVSLSEGVSGISNKMFYACGQLESIRIPTTCERINSEAFTMCFSLHTLVLPEGVKYLEKKVFDNAGLTDVYVMATSYENIPQIYDIGLDGNTEGTFSMKNLAGNYTDPRSTHKDDIGTADDETVLSYYQEEFSDMSTGLGGGNCMVQLHYPESMEWFYNNKDIPTLSYEAWSGRLGTVDKIAADFKLNGKTYIYEGYANGSHEYDAANGTHLGDSWPNFGPSESGKYWPVQKDYTIRLASGYTGTGEQSREAWRQFPLQGFAKINDETFTKKYDDTWYTMCFPWDMDDNTLFSTFNQKCEITEFVGVEVFKDDNAATENVVEYSMVFHFDHVAPTYYMDSEHNKYTRLSKDVEDYKVNGQSTTRTVTLNVNGVNIEKKYYTYKSEDNQYVYWPFNTNVNSLTDADKAMRDKYNSIKHLIVFAGRPYMIHPSIGAKTGQPKDCTVAGVQKVSLAEGETWDTYADKKKVKQIVTTNGTFQNPGTTLFVNPETNKGGSYFFIGNIGDKAKDMLNDERKMAYFLAVAEGEVYPKYYRKTSGGLSKWSQYSAIIYPDKDALDNIEGLDGMRVSSASGSKAFDVAFGEWEIVTPTAIEEVIADAEKSEKPMKQVHMNVVVNINGQVVRQGTSVEGLPKGLYIINGKKYMVK